MPEEGATAARVTPLYGSVFVFAGGATTVARYVIVRRIYPERLQPRIFGGFAAAWIIPALIGPAIAGIVGETVGWRWVFLGVVVLVVFALMMVIPAMRSLGGSPGENGAGMGLSTPRLSVLMLGYSIPENRGFSSSAMTIADAVGSGITLAILGILFGVAQPGSSQTAFVAVFLVALVLAAIAIAICGRVFPKHHR